ncbi:hypothetical protein [Peribacillus frigoritolerans]|uniref:hypothetical protein n=1 Tax=Peribacillus frigoritolerans TaxID=450367 RepID=UPI002416538B|nr:hypothetical protein [Peribacillus frigoritolerans]MDG4850264.1 hypothetical protein [Peribacillus frigoritolerans]
MGWSIEKVHQEIKLFYDKGEELTPKNVRKKYSGLYYAAIRHCDSWEKAVNGAGLIYENLVIQPWTAEKVIQEIKNVLNKGEDLSAKNIRDKYTSLFNAARRYFGSWKEACEKLGLEVEGRIRWDNERVIKEIKMFHERGESLHSRNVQRKNLPLLKAGKRYFESWDNALSIAGFDCNEIKKKGREEGFNLRSKNTQAKYTSEDFVSEQRNIIVKEILELHKEVDLLSHEYLVKNKSGLLHRMRRYFGSTTKAMNAADIDYEEIKKINSIKWNRKKISSEILRIKENNEPLNVSYIIKNHRNLYRAAVNHLDSWENALGLLGIDYDKIKREVLESVVASRTLYPQEFVVSELRKMKQEGMILSKKHVTQYNSALLDACYNRFGSLQNAIEEAGYDYDEELEFAREEWLKQQMKVQRKWTKEKVIDEILNLHKNDIPLSNSYIKHNYQSLYDGANNWVGSWSEAVTAAGLNYNEIREDRYKASYCGHLFEKLVDELLIDAGLGYEKYHHERWNPDYVLQNNIWMDAKLSQWTIYESKTIERYKEHCRLLTIVYMRGRRGEIGDEIIKGKVRLLSVYKLIKQLPKHKQKYYIDGIREITIILNEYESW